mmetsp:Transcript_96968/g.172602  ORF Transcript_96968/g.172602 Transcript_96968/m.172602 type:complete len:224 (-) Transcript_96968:260-931(-)
MLLSIEPVAFVPPLVRPKEMSKAGFAVVLVLAAVNSSVRPRVDAHSVNHAAFPLPFELTLVCTNVNARAVDAVSTPTSTVRRAISPLVDSVAVFLPSLELTLVSTAFLPDFHPKAMLQVVLPLTVIVSHLRLTSVMNVRTNAVGDVVVPLTTENVTIRVHKSALALGSITKPAALIDSTIRPPLDTKAMPLIAQPLTGIGTAVAKSVRWSFLFAIFWTGRKRE